jgi:hypothetical protein
MSAGVFRLIMVAAVAFAATPPRYPAPPVAGCDFRSTPHVIVDEVGTLLQYWIEEDRPALHGTELPASPSLQEFREQIARSYPTDVRILLEHQLPHTSGGDQENVRLVLDGEAGLIRPINCLEALLLSVQTERSVTLERSLYTHPTEFVSYVLERRGLLKIWFYTADLPGIGGISTLHGPLLRDLERGWTLRMNIHNHNFFPADEAVLGGIAPSATDIRFLRSMRESIGLVRASITNGFHSLDLSSSDLERFTGR